MCVFDTKNKQKSVRVFVVSETGNVADKFDLQQTTQFCLFIMRLIYTDIFYVMGLIIKARETKNEPKKSNKALEHIYK